MFRTTIRSMECIRSMLGSGYANCHRILAGHANTGAMQPAAVNAGRKCFSSENANIQVPVVSYEYVKDASSRQTKMLIDVREPSELQESGAIPTSINIPLADVATILDWPSSQFKAKFNRDKPQPTDELIFYCKIGMRSEKAAIAATRLGFANAKNYRGSWLDWAERENITDSKKPNQKDLEF